MQHLHLSISKSKEVMKSHRAAMFDSYGHLSHQVSPNQRGKITDHIVLEEPNECSLNNPKQKELLKSQVFKTRKITTTSGLLSPKSPSKVDKKSENQLGVGMNETQVLLNSARQITTSVNSYEQTVQSPPSFQPRFAQVVSFTKGFPNATHSSAKLYVPSSREPRNASLLQPVKKKLQYKMQSQLMEQPKKVVFPSTMELTTGKSSIVMPPSTAFENLPLHGTIIQTPMMPTENRTHEEEEFLKRKELTARAYQLSRQTNLPQFVLQQSENCEAVATPTMLINLTGSSDNTGVQEIKQQNYMNESMKLRRAIVSGKLEDAEQLAYLKTLKSITHSQEIASSFDGGQTLLSVHKSLAEKVAEEITLMKDRLASKKHVNLGTLSPQGSFRPYVETSAALERFLVAALPAPSASDDASSAILLVSKMNITQANETRD